MRVRLRDSPRIRQLERVQEVVGEELLEGVVSVGHIRDPCCRLRQGLVVGGCALRDVPADVEVACVGRRGEVGRDGGVSM